MREASEAGAISSPRLDTADAADGFEAFFDAESSILFKRMCLVTGNRAEAEELMQDAFLKLWERWDRVSSMADPTGYLYRTAMNLFRKRYRRTMISLRRTVSHELAVDEFDSVDARSMVSTALRSLAPRQRAALVLTELLGYGSEEAAKILGVRPGTVRALTSQARGALKRNLEERQ